MDPSQNMQKFLTPQNKTTNIDDLRLDAIIKPGNDGNIVIVGCPFDYARKRCINKGGQENGPCCIRRFYYKVGPLFNSQYQINISQTNITDYGNIQIDSQDIVSPQKIINKIQNQISILIANNRLPFVFGGSKQCTLGSARAFHKKFQEGKHVLIAGLSFLKRPFDHDKLTSQSLMTILTNQFPSKQILFGPHPKYFPNQYNKNFQYVSYNQIYQNPEQINNQGQKLVWQLGYSTLPVKKLSKTMNKDIPYHVTLSVEAIQRFNGCRDICMHGIKPEQMIEIFYWLGQNNNIKCVDITQFNPSCQDYESSLILLNFLYHFLLGWNKRTQNFKNN